jgi:hypothetical protein
LERIEQKHREKVDKRHEEAALEQTKRNAAHQLQLRRLLAANAKASDEPLKQGLALLGYFNVFFLLNVDSFTRDDLMSLVAVKLCANVVRPGLFLEDIALKVLEVFFAGLHVTPSLLKNLEDVNERIVLSKRSGEWLLTDMEYRNYLGEDIRTVAEPLSQIAKSLTIAVMELRRVETALQSLALLLVPDGAEDRRAAFFQGLLELANACARASLAENLEDAFVKNVLHPWSPEMHRPPALLNAKHDQLRELSQLHQELAALRQRRPEPAAELETAYAAKAKEAAFQETLFLRLRVLCAFQLQLVNVSAYNETGRSIKLAAFLTSPKLTKEKTSVYLLLCLHVGLSSVGYDLQVLRKVLDLLAPSKSHSHLLLVRTSAEMSEARRLFFKLRGFLQHVGRSPETEKYVKYIRAHSEDFLAKSCSELLARFPPPLQPKIEANERRCSSSAAAFGDIAKVVLQNEHHEHMSSEEVEDVICAVTDFFLHEEAQHSLHRKGHVLPDPSQLAATPTTLLEPDRSPSTTTPRAKKRWGVPRLPSRLTWI